MGEPSNPPPAETSAAEADQDLRLRATRDLLRYFVKPTPGAHERLGAYIDELLASDPAMTGKNKKSLGGFKNALMLSLRNVANQEAQTLSMIAQANDGKVATDQIKASQTALEEEYARVKSFRMRETG